MGTLLVVEDGMEYLDFFRLFIKGEHEYLHTQSGEAAVEVLDDGAVDMVILDMRFDRSDPEELLGDVKQVASEYFGGDMGRAQRYVEENQGTLVLAAMREAEHHQPVLFVHDMPRRKLENLRRLYGQVHAVPHFDAAAIRRAIGAALGKDR